MRNILEKFKILKDLKTSNFPTQYIGDMFHYTSQVGFNSILFGDEEKITLWASRFDCLNDSSEGLIARKVYIETCEKLLKSGEIPKEIYNIVASVEPAQTILVPKISDGDLKFVASEFDRFICSFSKNRDSLAMWNYYSKGNKYEGYNIGLNAEQIKHSLNQIFIDKEVQFYIYPVVYKLAEQEKMIKKFVKNLQQVYENQVDLSYKHKSRAMRNVVSNWLLTWGLIFKSEFFQHEEEVRIIIDVAKQPVKDIWDEGPIDIKYRNNSAFIVPYIELKIDKSALKYASVGPLLCDKKQKQLQRKVLEEVLMKNNYVPEEVMYSKITVRF